MAEDYASSWKKSTTSWRNGQNKEDIDSFTDDEEIDGAGSQPAKGVPMATPVFDGAKEAEIKELLRLADLDDVRSGFPV